MNIDRWSETFELLDETLRKHGTEAAAFSAACRCISAQDNEQLAADLLAFNALYPALIQDTTKPIVYIIIKLASYAIDNSDHIKRSLEETINAYGVEEIKNTWIASHWRDLEKQKIV